jgi:hypothetical protein
MCATKYGLYGDKNCRDLCLFGWLMVVLSVITIIIALALSIASTRLLLKRFNIFRINSHQVPPVTVLILLSITGILIVVLAIFEIITSIGFRDFFVVRTEEGRRVKRNSDAVESVSSIMYSVSFATGKCSFIILPLTWLDLVISSTTVRPTRGKLIIQTSLVFLVVILAVELPLTLHTSTQAGHTEAPPWTIASMIVWGIVCAYTLIVYTIAFVKVRQLKQNYFSHQSGRGNSIYKALTKIEISAVQLIFTDAIIFILMILGYFRTSRGIYDDPNCYVEVFDVFFRLTPISLALGCAAEVFYLQQQRSIRRTAGDGERKEDEGQEDEAREE